ncbi:helicase HerA-like domain-containing protein [Peptoniphilus mikwangii]|uniref:helicase HerA-like domain-containing protein n=1 Tax=Peptoniphilus mikwangii TaxID=1354300 RepID=UPI00056682D7|nr:helicase HerA-like domain-containing protein [Peptoniphilus mikwangii]
MMELLIARGNEDINLLSDKVNQHGLICGATGTGKTVTLKVLCEYFSDLGVPTILSDVKGDLANLCKIGTMNDKLNSRISELNLQNFEFKNYPITLWDVYGEKGLPLRITISEMGPILLSQILELNDTQTGILNIAFRVADEQGLLLIDIKDLRSMLNYLAENKNKYSSLYGNITEQSISAIQRKILMLEDRGGDMFFAEPALDINDIFKKDTDGRGYINILSSKKLINNPTLYSMFLLWLLSELFETLPEIGNPEIPKLVFFFDEAHLLFNNAPKLIQDKIEQVIRLIRSKGVGIFFITQNPLDIPSTVSSQLGNRIVHQLRAFSPRELKAIKEISETFRPNPSMNISEEITKLKTGEALISFLDESGAPSITNKALILPPHSSFDALTDDEYQYIISNSQLFYKYRELVDRESAYEILERKLTEQKQEIINTTQKIEELKLQREEEKLKAQREKELKKQQEYEERQRRKTQSAVTKGVDSFLNTMTRSIGREIARGLFGSITKKR